MMADHPEDALDVLLKANQGNRPLNFYTGCPLSPACDTAFKALIANDHEPCKDRLLRAWTRATSSHSSVQQLTDDELYSLMFDLGTLGLTTSASQGLYAVVLRQLQPLLQTMPATSALKTVALAAFDIHRELTCNTTASSDQIASRKASLACYRRAADALKDVGEAGDVYGRYEVMARAWVESAGCFYAVHQGASAVKCFKRTMKYLKSTRYKAHSIYIALQAAAWNLRRLMPAAELTAFMTKTVTQVCTTLTKETAFHRLQALLSSVGIMLSLSDLDACAPSMLKNLPCEGHGRDHPVQPMARPIEEALLLARIPPCVDYNARSFWTIRIVARRLEFDLPTPISFQNTSRFIQALSELDHYLDGTPLLDPPATSGLVRVLSTVRRVRQGVHDGPILGPADESFLTSLSTCFDLYFAKRAMAMDWITMLDRYTLLDKNTRDTMDASELLRALLPEFERQP
jgi:hypothetical protein